MALASAPIVWSARDKNFYLDDTFKLSELGDCSVPYLLALTECVYGCGLMSQRGKTPTAPATVMWDFEVAHFLPKVSSLLGAGPHSPSVYAIDHSTGDLILLENPKLTSTTRKAAYDHPIRAWRHLMK
jgi:hypothetical protein